MLQKRKGMLCMQEHYRQDLEELYQELGTCPEGLSSDTAAKCQEKYGKNAIAEGKKKPTLLIFLALLRRLQL